MATSSTKNQPLKELNNQIKTEMEEKHMSNNIKNGTVDDFNYKTSAGISTPHRIKVPKPFKYPERYTSPTDHIISPISKDLLARRSKRGDALLPPSKIQSKIRELQEPDVGNAKIQL